MAVLVESGILVYRVAAVPALDVTSTRVVLKVKNVLPYKDIY
jgi:hypothetical protein